MFYNIRDSKGRFSKPCKNCKPKTKSCSVVAGRLYDYLGSVVRAGRATPNGMRHVSFHKQLHGFVPESQLKFIDSSRVQEYLANAQA